MSDNITKNHQGLYDSIISNHHFNALHFVFSTGYEKLY